MRTFGRSSHTSSSAVGSASRTNSPERTTFDGVESLYVCCERHIGVVAGVELRRIGGCFMALVRTLGVGLLAVGVAVGGVGCGSTPDRAEAPTSAVAKPDLPDLTDAMILPQSGFPTVPGGEYSMKRVNPQPARPDAKPCRLAELIREGGQEARSKLRGANATYVVELYRTGATRDMHAWASKCFPLNDDGRSSEIAELPGLPATAIGIAAEDRGIRQTYGALGFVRGILIVATVSDEDGLPAEAKADIVKVFNSQAELLNSH